MSVVPVELAPEQLREAAIVRAELLDQSHPGGALIPSVNAPGLIFE